MVNRSFAASRLVNPAGASPVLTEAQVWTGLGIKARNPQSFVPAITSCKVVSDNGEKVRYLNRRLALHEMTDKAIDRTVCKFRRSRSSH